MENFSMTDVVQNLGLPQKIPSAAYSMTDSESQWFQIPDQQLNDGGISHVNLILPPKAQY